MHLESRSECTRQTGALSQKSRLAWFSVSEPLSAQNLPGLVIIASISTLRQNIWSVSGAQVLLSVGKSRWFIIRAFSLRFLVHFSIDSCHFDYAHVLRSALHSLVIFLVLIRPHFLGLCCITPPTPVAVLLCVSSCRASQLLDRADAQTSGRRFNKASGFRPTPLSMSPNSQW